LNAKRAKYLREQEKTLISELQEIREQLTEKTQAILNTHESIRSRELEIKECKKQIRKLEVWKERDAIRTYMIKKQSKHLEELETHVKGLSKTSAERFAKESERLKKEISREKEKTVKDMTNLEINVERSKLERNCRLALNELSELKERVWMGDHIKKEINSANAKLTRLEFVEELHVQIQSKLEDAQKTEQAWRNSVQSFFGIDKDLKTPLEAKLRFMAHQQEKLIKAASAESLLALEEKGKENDVEMTKLQARIQELTKALQRNSKTVDKERAKCREANMLKLKSENKIKSLQREVDSLTNV